jgi:phosphoribosylamine-glycine ligase
MLENPAQMLLQTAQNKKLEPRFVPDRTFGCSVTLAGYGYPYVQIQGPQLPIEVAASVDCDLWWNEVTCEGDGQLLTTGHRIADVVAIGHDLDQAIAKAYSNILKIRSLGTYYRQDIGKSLWPPGNE